MRIFIKTFGCQANISDSEKIAGLLERDYELVDNGDKSDVIIVNSCGVKSATQSTVLNYINKYKNKKIFVGGCLTKILDLRKKYPEINGVFDVNSISKIKYIIENEKDVFSNKKEDKINLPVIRKDKDVGIIVIGEGCLGNCNYCGTKLAKGTLKSYRIGDIKREFEKAIKDGCKRINLTSQDNGCYGYDIKTNLVELLNELVKVEGDFKIRVGMINPMYLDKRLLEVYESDKIMKFLHVPVQSGSDKVLEKMGRNYKIEEFKKKIKEFREKFFGISIATDIIVGYPLESEKDFLESCKLIEEIKPEVLNISMFSSRPNTEAAKLEQLDFKIVKERSRKLTKLFKSN